MSVIQLSARSVKTGPIDSVDDIAILTADKSLMETWFSPTNIEHLVIGPVARFDVGR